jgi:hypothetical protein
MRLVALVIAARGVASPAQTVVADRAPVTLLDQRPVEEDKRKTLSLWIGSCDYFVIRLDDAGMEKNRVDQLRDDLFRSLSKPATDTFYLKHYTLYKNAGVQMVDHALRAGAAAGGGMIAGGGPRLSTPRCSKDRMKGGWFDSSEVSNESPPLVAEVELAYSGRTFRARKVVQLEKGFNENSRSPKKYGIIKAEIFRSMNQDLAAQISAMQR